MKNYILEWSEELLRLPSAQLTSTISVVGRRNRQVGARLEFAETHVKVEPSASFEVIDATGCLDSDDLRKHGLLDRAVFWMS